MFNVETLKNQDVCLLQEKYKKLSEIAKTSLEIGNYL